MEDEILQKELAAINERNARVEADKAWEMSIARRVTISVLTYIFALAWLAIIHEPSLWWKAGVPVAGYILSTLTLPFVKNKWIQNR